MINVEKVEDIFTITSEDYYVYLVFTDEITFIKADEGELKKFKEKGTELLLECRLFNENEEIRFKRTGIEKEFVKRIIDDCSLLELCPSAEKDLINRTIDDQAESSDFQNNEYFDKSYFLDIDAARLKDDDKCSFVTTGGVKEYRLPVEINTAEINDGVTKGGKNKKRVIANTKLQIRYYLGYYEETGQAYIKDWRLVGFEEYKGQEEA